METDANAPSATERNADSPNPTKVITQEAPLGPRNEVSAATIGMMLGLATSKEVQIIENRLELLTQKISNISTRVEKLIGMAQAMPSGSDLERIDVQIGGLKSMVRDVLTEFAGRSTTEDQTGKPTNEEQKA